MKAKRERGESAEQLAKAIFLIVSFAFTISLLIQLITN